jgi:hypothetical protein
LYEIQVPRLDELVWSNDQTGSVNRSDTLNFTLQPGDNIYVYAWQLAWATENGSSADARGVGEHGIPYSPQHPLSPRHATTTRSVIQPVSVGVASDCS